MRSDAGNPATRQSDVPTERVSSVSLPSPGRSETWRATFGGHILSDHLPGGLIRCSRGTPSRMTEQANEHDHQKTNDTPTEGQARRDEAQAAAEEFENDPARNPSDETLKDIKGG